MRVAVLGGGIAGLTAAMHLRERGHEPIVLERARTAGGKVRTERVGAWQVELGPAGVLDNAPATDTLYQRLGLASQIVQSDDAARRRFVVREGRLREVPDSPPKLVFSSALTFGDKWHLLREPKAPVPPLDVDETVAEFARRRLGPELARRFVEPMVSGVFAGDYARLSAKSAFPRLVALEREHGSLLRALIALERARRATGQPRKPARLTSLVGGMGALSAALSRTLGDSLHLEANAETIERDDRGLLVRTSVGPMQVDRVVLALPPAEAARVSSALDPALSDAFRAIPTAGIASVSLGYERAEIRHPLLGFGFLVPRIERVRLLGALWMTSAFPALDQAPPGHVLIRCMIGGAQDPDALALSDDALITCAREGLRATMGLSAVPRFSHVLRWTEGIPQYLVGHQGRVALIERRGAELGIYPTGSGLRGISVHDVVREAAATVERLARDASV